MRNRILLAVVAVMCVACANAPSDCTEPDACSAADCPQEPVPAPSAGPTKVRIFDVADLVSPPGDPDRVADLASTIYADVTFLVGDVDSTVDAHGSSIVMKSTPHVLARVANHLARKRAGVSPNWL